MQTLLKTNSRKIFKFHGGVHPPEHKQESSHKPLAQMPIPPLLTVPLHQSMGNAAKPLVEVGERVLKGQIIGAAQGVLSSAVHAPSSGTVVAIDMQVVAHPSGLPDLCVTIETDGLDEWQPRTPIDYHNTPAQEVREYLQEMGVVGLGGAVFPTHLKLNKGKGEGLETLVINGAECEPYITCDDRLMQERADEVVSGILIMRDLLNAKEVLIGIEDNKPEAVHAMRAAIAQRQAQRLEVVVIPTLYPSGGAKQLIKILTGKEVPSGVRSTDLGVQCFNVATAYTVHRALNHGEPVLSRIVTITGNVHTAQNVEALIGTPVAALTAVSQEKPDSNGYIMGGPMMGVRLAGAQVAVTKATNCIIVASDALFPPPASPMPCIRCAKCADVCPANLQPQDLYWFSQAKQFEKAKAWSLFDCIECGACAYVCPSEIPLVDFYRFAKSEIWEEEREQKAADIARQRHEFQQFRIEREKQEKAERLAAKTAAAKKAAEEKAAKAASEAAQTEGQGADSAQKEADAEAEKQAKIQAALARVAAKKAEAAAEAAKGSE